MLLFPKVVLVTLRLGGQLNTLTLDFFVLLSVKSFLKNSRWNLVFPFAKSKIKFTKIILMVSMSVLSPIYVPPISLLNILAAISGVLSSLLLALITTTAKT